MAKVLGVDVAAETLRACPLEVDGLTLGSLSRSLPLPVAVLLTVAADEYPLSCSVEMVLSMTSGE